MDGEIISSDTCLSKCQKLFKVIKCYCFCAKKKEIANDHKKRVNDTERGWTRLGEINKRSPISNFFFVCLTLKKKKKKTSYVGTFCRIVGRD